MTTVLARLEAHARLKDGATPIEEAHPDVYDSSEATGDDLRAVIALVEACAVLEKAVVRMERAYKRMQQLHGSSLTEDAVRRYERTAEEFKAALEAQRVALRPVVGEVVA